MYLPKVVKRNLERCKRITRKRVKILKVKKEEFMKGEKSNFQVLTNPLSPI